MYHPLHHSKTSLKDKQLFRADLLGWLGAILLIAAYILLSFGVIDSKSLPYQLLNVGGAVGLLVMGFARKAYPSVATNSVWLIVTVIAIINLIV